MVYRSRSAIFIDTGFSGATKLLQVNSYRGLNNGAELNKLLEKHKLVVHYQSIVCIFLYFYKIWKRLVSQVFGLFMRKEHDGSKEN